MPRLYAATGHRPLQLGGYGLDARQKVNHFAYITIHEMVGTDPDLEFIVGMAIGWDTAVALACRELRVPYHAALPFHGQEDLWNPTDQKIYWDLIGASASTIFVSDGGFDVWKLQVRNKYMVDKAEKVLALCNGLPSGTKNCVGYANAKGKEVIHVWEKWIRFKG